MMSLLPIDVGFDLRVHRDMGIIVDDVMARDGVIYLGKQGREMTAQGTKEEVAAALRAAGYRVEID